MESRHELPPQGASRWVSSLSWSPDQSPNSAKSIDTTTPGGRLVFHVFASLAEFERDLIRERTQAGLAAARGRQGGRPTVLSPVKRKQATRMITEGTPIVEVAQALGVSRSTLYRQLRPMPAPGT